jgi:GNAT-family acetyltransferase (TIGR03103 family)
MSKSNHRIEKASGQSLRNWEKIQSPETKNMMPDSFVEMGWGRLVFGHTFISNEKMVEAMCSQGYDSRDIAIYVIDPHVIVSMAPDKLFIDPSHTFRLWSYDYRCDNNTTQPFVIQRLSSRNEADAVNRIYAACHMKGADPDFMIDKRASKLRTYLIARDVSTNNIVGTVSGVDHVEAFEDPENGSSLWSLAVDPQAKFPGIGSALVRHIVEHYFTKGRSFVDASVIYDNTSAIQLYTKIGFQRIPAFCIKRKNPINQRLYIAPNPENELNPYAKIIVDEARNRGILIDIIDEKYGLFNLTFGSRTIACRESLSEMTNAIAMTKCDDKRLTRKLVKNKNIQVPLQKLSTSRQNDHAFMDQVGHVVVKPARGEQGTGISVDISSEKELDIAIKKARETCSDVLLEEFIEGVDLRVIVINYEVVAAAVRKPPAITGTGNHTISDLIEKYNRRRLAATGGESKIPMDNETLRCLKRKSYDHDSILEKGKTLVVRKTANLHTGGTIHDVTDQLSDTIKLAAVEISRTIDIPVTGLDFIVPDIRKENYAFIEANERPGLANHEPQPTAERFIDYLFPETVSNQ